MYNFTKQYNKDIAILFSPILFFILSGLIAFFAFKAGILDEANTMALAAMLSFCSLVGYLIFTFKYRLKTKKMGLIALEEMKSIISAEEIITRPSALFYRASLSGAYKNYQVSVVFNNTWIRSRNKVDFSPRYMSFVTPAQININLNTKNDTPDISKFGLLFSKPKKITENITLESGILSYKTLALTQFFNYTDRKQQFIAILEELIQATEMVD